MHGPLSLVEWCAAFSSRTLRSIEAFETRSRWPSANGANRTHHALPLQVIFSALAIAVVCRRCRYAGINFSVTPLMQ